MSRKKEVVTDAEAFVRKALAQLSNEKPDEATVKAVARKVSKAVPPYREREQVAA